MPGRDFTGVIAGIPYGALYEWPTTQELGQTSFK
jgi:hypothetical protein